MSNNAIFITQVASIVAFVVALFVLYRLLVETKDATIQLLKEKTAALESALATAREAGPDALAERLGARVKLLTGELERLSVDEERNAAAIHEKESELQGVRDQLSELQDQMERAKDLMSEYFCPDCGAAMSVREYHSESVWYNGCDVDVDHECIEYECGLTIVDGERRRPCRAATETAADGRGPSSSLKCNTCSSDALFYRPSA
jgi:hypothetical protein